MKGKYQCRWASMLSNGLLYLACLIVLVFLMAPLLVVIPISMTPSRYFHFPPTAISLRWYLSFFENPKWIRSFLLSLRIALCTTGLATILGTIAAYVASRARFPFKNVVATLIVSPSIVAVIVLAVGFYFFFAKIGLLDTATGLILAHTVLAIPFVFIIVASVLEDLDESLEKAALGLGASRWITFWRIVFPQIKHGILAGAIISFITSFDEIVIAIFVCGTRLVTLPKRMWDGIRFEIDPTIAVVSTFVLTITVLGIFVIIFLSPARKKGKDYIH